MIVADTNLIAYLLIKGEHTATARAVYLRESEWAVPMLWRSEFRNLLANHLRRRTMGIAEALRLQEQAESLLAGQEHEVQSPRVLRLAAESGCTAYDCEFVALAEYLDAKLVTYDREILRCFPNIATAPEALVAG